ncbi:MAG: NAD(P)/FAD-dependent oxidoreductase, partial [Proteobacteria bacterium]
MKNPIVIIGAGLSGLNAALEIEAAGESCVILDEAAHVGGKLESTVIDESYIVDRGFQILLPAYPELQRLGNLEQELDLKYFATGARLEREDGALMMGDPRQHPNQIASTVFGNYGSL